MCARDEHFDVRQMQMTTLLKSDSHMKWSPKLHASHVAWDKMRGCGMRGQAGGHRLCRHGASGWLVRRYGEVAQIYTRCFNALNTCL